MKRLLLSVFLLALTACGEEKLQPLDEYESAELQARAWNFQVYPGAEFLPRQTALLRKAHFVMNPAAKEAPPMAMYVTDVPVDTVARWYGSKYGYPEVAESQVNDFKSVGPAAYFASGDLRVDMEGIRPLFPKLGVNPRLAAAQGTYRGAHISPHTHFPRVTVQRPYYDLINDRKVERTLIVLVKE